MIGRQSYLRRFLEGKTRTHTRAMYTDADYRKGIVYTYALQEGWEADTVKFKAALKQAAKSYKFLRCPCCMGHLNHHSAQRTSECSIMFASHAEKDSGLYGNSRHYQFYCMNDSVQAVRERMTQTLEDHLTYLFRIAAKWGRQGFSTLLSRVT
jgi:hypothetical protein